MSTPTPRPSREHPDPDLTLCQGPFQSYKLREWRPCHPRPRNNAALWILTQRQGWLQSLVSQSGGRGAGREQRTCSGLEQLRPQTGAQEPAEPWPGWAAGGRAATAACRTTRELMLSLLIQMTL